MAIDKEKIFDLAQKYTLKRQFQKAIKEYLKLIEESPKDKRLYLKIGDLYLKTGESEKSIQEYLKLADLYAEEDLNSRAISIYKKVLSINPKLVEAHHRMAKLYLKEGLIGSAKSCYQSILEIRPDDQEALKALEDLKKHRQPSSPSPAIDDSILSLETKIPPPDKDSETHYHLGIAYKEMELFDYAISEFESASSNPSIQFDCYIMLGDCHMQKGDYGKSIEYYKMASKIKGLTNEKLARLHFSLGLAYEANGMVSEALDTFKLVLKLDHSLTEAEKKLEKLAEREIK